jgi:phosphoglycolate phosphatase-like HAD superfamily hydrolase
MTPFLLLWDIDGTILRSGGAGMKAMYKVAGRLFGEHHSWEGIDPGGNLDPAIFAEYARINRLSDDPAHHAAFHEHYLAELQAQLAAAGDAVLAMPGIHGLFALLRERQQTRRDIVMGLLTGNYTRAVPLKLEAVGVDPAWFQITAFGDEGKTRPDLVALARKKFERLTGHAPDIRRVIVIGDTPRDVQCAHAHGCVSLAVATGGHSVEVLRDAGAEVVVPDLADPSPLLRLIDG